MCAYTIHRSHGEYLEILTRTSEMEQDLIVLPLHALHLPFVCGKTLVKE